AVFVKVGGRFAMITAQPEADVVVEERLIAEPAAFGDVKARGAADRVVTAGVANGREEFRDDKTVRSFDQVLAKRPPPEIIHLLHLAVRAFEERNIFFQ